MIQQLFNTALETGIRFAVVARIKDYDGDAHCISERLPNNLPSTGE